MRRAAAATLFLAAGMLAGCADLLGPTPGSGPDAPPAAAAGLPRVENGFTVTGTGALAGREPLLPSAREPDLRGGTLLQGPPGTPMAPPLGTSPSGL